MVEMKSGELSADELRKLPIEKLHQLLREGRLTIEELEEKMSLEELLEKFPDVTEDSEGERRSGVLLSDEIKRYSENYHLIFPFDERNLKGASYYLTVGNEYAVGGRKKELSDKSDKLIIPPFEVAIIKTREIINMPRFLIGRWNIRVTNAYKGLLWVGGPQVDPGWVGHLFCPVYNLSNEDVELKLGSQLATIDFVLTTPYDKEKEECKKFAFNREKAKKRLEEYNWRLESALFTEAKKKVEEIKEKMETDLSRFEANLNRFETKLDTSIGIIFTAIAIIVAALSILVTSDQPKSLPTWLFLSLAFSIIAITLSIFSLIKSKKVEYKLFNVFVIVYILLSAIAIGILLVKTFW